MRNKIKIKFQNLTLKVTSRVKVRICLSPGVQRRPSEDQAKTCYNLAQVKRTSARQKRPDEPLGGAVKGENFRKLVPPLAPQLAGMEKAFETFDIWNQCNM